MDVIIDIFHWEKWDKSRVIAGRHTQGGTFNLSVDAAQRGGLSEGSIQAIEEQVFTPVRKVYYRNPNLDFQSIDHFWKSLQQRAYHSCMLPQGKPSTNSQCKHS